MSIKMLGFVLMVLGSLLQIVSLLADFIGLGKYPASIGWKQITGALVGLVIIWIGYALIPKKSETTK